MTETTSQLVERLIREREKDLKNWIYTTPAKLSKDDELKHLNEIRTSLLEASNRFDERVDKNKHDVGIMYAKKAKQLKDEMFIGKLKP